MTAKTHASAASGAALVIVIVLVSMLMVMILAFFSLAKIERRASSAYAQTVTADVLSESALNTVIAQVRDATSNLGTTETWASQPGMIRRYDNRGELVGAYKLYSSDTMVAGSGFDPDNELPPGDWQSKPGLWTDLNEPVLFDRDGDGTPDDQDGDGNPDASYPIVHPAAINAVEGFDIENAPGAYDNQPIPMPVQWLYMLEDGSLAGASGASGTEVTVSNATASNPVVGRIAFWADDECSKVNINTASEGFYWDPPRTNSTSETHFADRQPMVSEFQRYAGHPATTCLSPILGNWLGDPASTTMERGASMLQNYYKLTPRIVYGGSVEATRSRAQINTSTFRRYTLNLNEDRDRLYASVDEYVFNASDFSGNIRSDNEGMKPAGGGDSIRDVVEKTRFFLTSHSQAPEVTLFNQPRIALWPIQAEEGDRNTVDELIAFCASTRSGSTPVPYYFQRPSVHNRGAFSSSQSPTQFWTVNRNQQLYGYLQDMMDRPIPGYGDSFSNKFKSDADQVAIQMVDYLRSGLNTSSFGRKTDNNRNGYSFVPPRSVRGFTPSVGESQVIPLKLQDTMGFGRNQTITEAAIVIYPTRYTQGVRGYVNDIPGPNNRKLSGFRASAVQAFLLLEFFNPAPGLPSWSPYITVEVQGLDGFSLSEGGSLNMPASASMTLDSIIGPAGGQVGQDAPGDNDRAAIGYGNNTPHFGMFQPFYRGGTRPTKIASEREYAFKSSADCSISGSADPKDSPLTLQGGDLVITLKSGATGEVVQTINMEFPDMKIPRPYVYTATANANSRPQPYETSLTERIKRGARNYQWALIRPGDVVRSMEADKDAPPKGDLRFYSATPNVPAEWFRAGGGYRRDRIHQERVDQWNSTDPLEGRFAQGLRQYNDWQFWGQFCTVPRQPNGNDAINGNRGDHPFYRIESLRTSGSLVPRHHLYTASGTTDWSVYRDAHFVTARGLAGAFRSDGQPGDFDSGFGFVADGPYVNKPDEGNAYSPSGMRSFEGGNARRVGAYYNVGHFDADAQGINTFPNRQIASAVQFGSLPTGIKRGQPWETLLFTPAPAGANHPGATSPPDHLVADWWWMPAAEPYPISQPMATSGKINLNYDILPFRYIKRRTPIHSLLKAVQVTAIPPYFATRHATQGKSNNYRQGLDAPVSQASRYAIDPDHTTGTLKGFEDKFEDGEIFRSATEICEVFLVPKQLPDFRGAYPSSSGGASYDRMERWWRGSGINDVRNFSLTGDNLRETPYNHIYPRCTTKSNTFRIHMRVQRLTPSGNNPQKLDLNTARTSGDWRGSVLIERFVDPNDPDLPDFARDKDQALDDYYRIRVIERKEFNPL